MYEEREAYIKKLEKQNKDLNKKVSELSILAFEGAPRQVLSTFDIYNKFTVNVTYYDQPTSDSKRFEFKFILNSDKNTHWDTIIIAAKAILLRDEELKRSNQISYEEVQENFSMAWNMLPSSYQNDHCLTFFTKSNVLYAAHDIGNLYYFNTNSWHEMNEPTAYNSRSPNFKYQDEDELDLSDPDKENFSPGD